LKQPHYNIVSNFQIENFLLNIYACYFEIHTFSFYENTTCLQGHAILLIPAMTHSNSWVHIWLPLSFGMHCCLLGAEVTICAICEIFAFTFSIHPVHYNLKIGLLRYCIFVKPRFFALRNLERFTYTLWKQTILNVYKWWHYQLILFTIRETAAQLTTGWAIEIRTKGFFTRLPLFWDTLYSDLMKSVNDSWSHLKHCRALSDHKPLFGLDIW
jgi:hypothetical protein